MASVSCSAKVDFACSGRVEVCDFALRESCFAATSFTTCSMICSAVGYSDCSGLARVEVTRAWTDEDILLKYLYGSLEDLVLHQSLRVPLLWLEKE